MSPLPKVLALDVCSSIPDRELSGPVELVDAKRPRAVLRRIAGGVLSQALAAADHEAPDHLRRKVVVRGGEVVAEIEYEPAAGAPRKTIVVRRQR